MKRHRKNSGFTLVECVVAMAVLAVMMVGVLMLMNAIVKQRNRNIEIERDIDDQVEQVVQNGGKHSEDVDKIDIGGYKVDAQKVYNDPKNGDLQIGQIKFGEGSSPEPEPEPGTTAETSKPVEQPPPENKHENPLEGVLVYGSVETNLKTGGKSYITVSQVGYTENLTDDDNDPATPNIHTTTTLTWQIEFNPISSTREDKSIKVVFPSYAKMIFSENNVSYPHINQGNCNVHRLSDNIVRIEPTGTGNIQVQVRFTIPADKYDDNLIAQHFGSTKPIINEKA